MTYNEVKISVCGRNFSPIETIILTPDHRVKFQFCLRYSNHRDPYGLIELDFRVMKNVRAKKRLRRYWYRVDVKSSVQIVYIYIYKLHKLYYNIIVSSSVNYIFKETQFLLTAAAGYRVF